MIKFTSKEIRFPLSRVASVTFWDQIDPSPLCNDFVEWLQTFILLNSSNPTYATYTDQLPFFDLQICPASISHAVDCYVFGIEFQSDHYPCYHHHMVDSGSQSKKRQ
ncbi:hypothetical protein AVEN_55839-1 [Araneus ventricosus]|uniref:Endonuclease/exonuclease/phosphatase domain-containing protein n=1 Tax=Araneus ventricosus TaxID=182803 RepID=A0A4Y2CPZ2_ARAVE|nr:hypothetical protein AVEN_55839-1 [Araneus ventricosus]